MRLPSLLRLLLLTLLACAWVALPATASAETMQLEEPVTDNYKASYNDDPSVTELRTWLSIKNVHAAGTTWAPAAPSEIVASAGGSVTVYAADGRSGTFTYARTSGPVDSMLMRVDPLEVESHGKWGPLITISGRAELQAAPAVFSLSLVSGGVTLATGSATYRYDAAVANVSSSSIEYNGPGGRWVVGTTDTRLNWETAAGAAPVVGADVARGPKVTKVILPARSSSRFVKLRVLGRAGTSKISHIRVRIGQRGFGRWITVRKGYTVVLPKANGSSLVRVQLRDAGGLTSGVSGRRVYCSCG